MVDCESGVWFNIGECFMYVNFVISVGVIRFFDVKFGFLLCGFYKGILNLKFK